MATNEEYDKTFLQADSLQEAKDALEEVNEANPDAIIIVEEDGKECLIEHDKRLNFVPSGGLKGQVLTANEEGNPEWGEAVDASNFLTSKQAAQKYYPKTDGEDLELDVAEHDRAIGVIELQIGNLSFRAISKDDYGNLGTKEPNTLYIITA